MRRTTILGLSLVANAVLGIIFWLRHPTALSELQVSAAKPEQSTLARIPAALTDTQRWQKISGAGEDPDFVAQLRSAGFPSYVIRALVQERIVARYASRLRALKQKGTKNPYWQSGAWYDSVLDLATRTELRAVDREVAGQVQALLGDDPEALSSYQRAYRARSYGNLPPVKVSAIEAINRDYSEIAAQVRAGTQGVILAADRAKLILLENEKRADLTRLLTPEELVEYDIRNSPAASEIRNKLRYFDATEPEFLALYQLQREFDTRYGRDNLSGEQSDHRRAALPELAQQMKDALGTERFASYEILTDGNYFATRGVMTDLGLTAESATTLVRVQRDTNRRAEIIRTDTALTADQRNVQLATLAQEATAQIIPTLGSAENLTSYKRFSAGQWLTRLTPPEKPAAKP